MGMLINTPILELGVRVDNRQRLVAMQKEITRQIDVETDCLKNELAALGIDAIDVGTHVVTLQVRDRKTLDKGALIEQGVTVAQIERATKTSTYTQLDVRERKAA